MVIQSNTVVLNEYLNDFETEDMGSNKYIQKLKKRIKKALKLL